MAYGASDTDELHLTWYMKQGEPLGGKIQLDKDVCSGLAQSSTRYPAYSSR
jgi:hypothetical protein